jgi:hypothetical protein
MNSLFTPSAEPYGRYMVWHAEGDKFRCVASVTCGNLLAALVLPDLKHGNPGTERVADFGKARPTNIGDVIVNPDGQAYRIDRDNEGEKFQLIHFAPEMERRAEFAREQNEPEIEL